MREVVYHWFDALLDRLSCVLDHGHDWCEYRVMDKPHRRCRRCNRCERQIVHSHASWVRA